MPIIQVLRTKKTVAVIGAGLSGSLAARELAQSGFAVTVFDSQPQGSINATNVSGGLVRAFDLDPGQRADAASVVYGANSVRGRGSGFVRAGALVSGVDPGEATDFVGGFAAEHGFEARVMSAEDVRGRFGIELPPESVSVFEPGAGFLSPRKVASFALRVASGVGAVVRFSSPVASVTTSANCVSLSVAGQREPEEFDYAVVALGAWMSGSSLGIDGMLPSRVMAIQVVCVTRPYGVHHPTLFDYDSGVYAAPISPGVSLIGLTTGEHYDTISDPGLRRADPAHVTETLSRAVDRLPWVSSASVVRVIRGFDGVVEPGTAGTTSLGEDGRIMMVRPWNGAGVKHALSAARQLREALVARA